VDYNQSRKLPVRIQKPFTTPMPPLARKFPSTALCAGIALCLFIQSSPLWAKGKSPQTSSEAVVAKKKTVSKVTYQRSSSEETPAQRDKRMYRECRGMHNAGACSGYTRK
jgi:hypothetical protein